MTLGNSGLSIFSGVRKGSTFTTPGIPYVDSNGNLSTETALGYNSSTNTLSVDAIDAPTGRTATYVIAASDATAMEKAQADLVCSAATPGVEINAALTAAGVNTGISFSSGTYTLEVPIVPLAGQTLFTNCGAIFEAGAATTLISISSTDDVTIEGITLDGNDTAEKGIYVLTSKRPYINSCKIHDFTTIAIDLESTSAEPKECGTVVNNDIYDCGDLATQTGIGLALGNAGGLSEYTVVSGNHICSNGVGIKGVSNNNQFTGNHVDSNGYGYWFTGARQQIVGGTANHCILNGLIITAGAGHQITGLTITQCGQAGVNLGASLSNVVFTACYIYNNAINDPGSYNDCEVVLNRSGVANFIFDSCLLGDSSNADPNYAIYNRKTDTTAVIFTNCKLSNGASGIFYTTTGFTIENNIGYIALGEIRTYSGTLTLLAQDNITSIDNPFGQTVRVLSLDLYISTAAGDTTPNSTIDSGIGSSATTDYTTLFEGVDCEVTGFYNSVNSATVGKQTVPQLWASGSGNRYANISVKDEAATGMVCTYVFTVMGN